MIKNKNVKIIIQRIKYVKMHFPQDTVSNNSEKSFVINDQDDSILP